MDEHIKQGDLKGSFKAARGVIPTNPEIDAPPEAFIRGARDDFEPLYRHYRAKAEEFYAALSASQQRVSELEAVLNRPGRRVINPEQNCFNCKFSNKHSKGFETWFSCERGKYSHEFTVYSGADGWDDSDGLRTLGCELFEQDHALSPKGEAGSEE